MAVVPFKSELELLIYFADNTSWGLSMVNKHTVDYSLEDACAICTEDYDEEFPVKMQCGHVFGTECIRTWLIADSRTTGTCPMCRVVLYDVDRSLPAEILGDVTSLGFNRQTGLERLLFRADDGEEFLLEYVNTDPVDDAPDAAPRVRGLQDSMWAPRRGTD